MDELKELRNQMSAMKDSLERYEIINERLMHTVMEGRSKGLNWFVSVEMITVPFLCLFFFGVCAALHLTMWLAITISVACVVSTIWDMKTMRVPRKLINKLSHSDLRRFLIRQKRMRAIQLAVELPLSIAWVIWFMLAYLGNEVMFGDLVDSKAYMWAKIIFIAVMVLLVIVVVMVIFRKSQRINDSMISDIDSSEEDA